MKLVAVGVTATLLIGSAPTRARADEDDTRRAVSLGSLVGFHLGAYAWTYFAWYRGRETRDHVQLADEGWFGPETYAGGADKLGHGFANYAFARGSMGLLEYGGWDRTTSLAVSGGLTALFFTLVEIKDGLHEGYGFSVGDMMFNLAGNGLGLLMETQPRLDELFDYRIEYIPTDEFIEQIKQRGVDVAEDYSGMTFGLMFHLGALEGVHAGKPRVRWARFVDVTLGFETRGYLPEPLDPMERREQRLFLGLSLDVQRLIREYVGREPLTELYTIPFTTLPILDAGRSRPPEDMPAPLAR